MAAGEVELEEEDDLTFLLYWMTLPLQSVAVLDTISTNRRSSYELQAQ